MNLNEGYDPAGIEVERFMPHDLIGVLVDHPQSESEVANIRAQFIATFKANETARVTRRHRRAVKRARRVR
jgi:hypothetical protein